MPYLANSGSLPLFVTDLMKIPTILIVEDEPIIAADLMDRLMTLGFEVMANVSSGEEALLKVDQQTPDLILMDVNLAGKLDGVETALQLREKTDAPLIFLTSNSEEKTFRRAQQANPQAFLMKPFRGKDLDHAIALAIGESSPTPSTSPAIKDDSAHNAQDRLFIKVKERLIRVMISDILYLEADDYYCKVYTAEKTYLATKTLKKISAQLPADAPFFRCHRSYVVNLNRITEIGELFVFLDKHKVPLSRSKRAEIFVLINKM